MKNPEDLGDYHNADWVKSRHKIVDELREISEKELPKPESNWEVVWVFSGPELNWEGNKVNPGERSVGYNQTRKRWETGLKVAREVTACRLNKKPEEVTMEEIKKSGPKIYYNGTKEGNDNFREFSKPGGQLEIELNFPSSNVVISENADIKHTGNQFEDFPSGMVLPGNKLVIVSDLYHLPRLKRYTEKYHDKFSQEQTVFYPAEPLTVPVAPTLEEIKKIFRYIKGGILPPDSK